MAWNCSKHAASWCLENLCIAHFTESNHPCQQEIGTERDGVVRERCNFFDIFLLPYYRVFWHMRLLSEHALLLEYRGTKVNRNIYNIGAPAFSINSHNAVFGYRCMRKKHVYGVGIVITWYCSWHARICCHVYSASQSEWTKDVFSVKAMAHKEIGRKNFIVPLFKSYNYFFFKILKSGEIQNFPEILH